MEYTDKETMRKVEVGSGEITDNTVEKAVKTSDKKNKKQSNSDFKSKYFEYYDDIKISDRQDW